MNGGKLNIRLLRLKYRFDRGLKKLAGRQTYLQMSSLAGFYRKVWEEAARELSAEFSEIAHGYWEVSKGGKRTFINNYVVQIDDPVILNVAGNKALSYRIIRDSGLPVPDHACYTLNGIEKAGDFIKRFDAGYFVIKPSTGTSGARGITTHLEGFKECVRASVLASLFSDDILIERLIPGESYRLLVLDGEMILASRRKGVWVEGDGASTVMGLVQEELRRGAADGAARCTDSDRDLIATLRVQGLTPSSVVEKGRKVLAKSVKDRSGEYSEVRTAYDEDATGLICAGLKKEAERAAMALNSRFAGIDIVTMDPSKPLAEGRGAVVEVNTTPGLHHHYNLSGNGPTQRPAVKVLRYLLRG